MASHLEPNGACRGPCWHGEREAVAEGDVLAVAPAPRAVPVLRTPPVRRGELVSVTLLAIVISEDTDPALVELTEVPDVRRPIRLWVGQAEAARV